MARIKFNQAVQFPDEVLTIWNARRKTLFRLGYPDQSYDMENHINLKDRFINRLSNIDQKKYILEQRKLDDNLNHLMHLGLKFASVQLVVNPKSNVKDVDV